MKKKLWIVGLIASVSIFTACSTQKEAQVEKTEKPEEITLYIARHGKTMLNTIDRSQGWIDAPLTPAGVEVAEFLGKGLNDVTFDAAYSSDSGRAIETATIVLNNNGQEKLANSLTKDMRFREFNFGTFEGMMNDEMWGNVAEKNGMTLEEFQANIEKEGFVPTIKTFTKTLAEMDTENVEDGVNWPAEDYEAVSKRVKEGLDDIVKKSEKNGDDTVLVVSHGMTIGTLLSELDESAEIPASGLKNASVSKVVYKDGKYTVESVNDMSYVEAGQK